MLRGPLHSNSFSYYLSAILNTLDCNLYHRRNLVYLCDAGYTRANSAIHVSRRLSSSPRAVTFIWGLSGFLPRPLHIIHPRVESLELVYLKKSFYQFWRFPVISGSTRNIRFPKELSAVIQYRISVVFTEES